MSERRNIQFLRNDVALVASHEVARERMAAAFAKMTDVKDGEIFLYRYSLTNEENSPIFTSVAAVYVDENSTDTLNRTPRIEVLGNYTELSDAIKVVDNKVAEVNTKVNTLNDTINGKEGVDGLTTRMTEAEGKISGHTTSIENINSNVNTLSGKISANEGAINDVKGRMDTAETNIEAVEVRMGTAESAITAVEGRMDTAETDIEAVEVRMGTAEGAITGLQNSISGMTLAASDVVAMNEAGTALQASKISETDGKVTVETAETIVKFNQAISSDNKVATMADITAAAYTAGKGITITDKAIAADLTLSYNEETKIITLVGANNATYGEINASVFIKDGILDNATYNPENNKLSLTFNTDAGKDTIEVDLGDLVDTYTADETYLTVANNKFSHKTIDGLDSENTHGLTANVTVNSTTSTSFNVPSLKVDAAGHVVSVDEKQVTISLPASINTALQTVSAQGDSKYITATFAEKNGTSQALTVSAITGTVVNNEDKLAVASDVKSYVDNAIANTPKVNTVTELTAGSGITVTDGATDGNHNYTVGLKIDSTSMLSIKEDGALTISNVVDCGKYAE